MFKKFFGIAAVVVVAAVITSCNNGGSSDGGGSPANPPPPGEFNVDDLGYNPYQRWPQDGNYKYDYKYNVNGQQCQTVKSFTNLATYCLGLQDQHLNEGCALPMRQGDYKRNCGDDFQQLNFLGEFWKSGFDSDLQQRCETARPQVSYFKTLKQYCEFIKDEVLHKNCFWSDRYAHFKSKNCRGEFSQQPATVITQPIDPKPPVIEPTPPPMNDPVQDIPIVKELKANGIPLTVDWEGIRMISSGPHFPGDGSLPLDEQMKILWAELEANKAEIIKRKNVIKEIDVTIYTNYRKLSGVNSWSIDFETQPKQLSTYFPLFDKILKYSAELKINFDIIHSGYRTDKISYSPLRQILDVVDRSLNEFRTSAGLFQVIKVDSYSNYYSADQTLTLNRDKIAADFDLYLRLLKPLAPTLNWFKNNSVSLDVDFDIEKDSQKVYQTFRVLEKSIPSLDAMAKANVLKDFQLYLSDDDQFDSFYLSLKKVTLSISAANSQFATDMLARLGKQAKMMTQSGIEIDIASSDLDDIYSKSFAQLERFWTQIMAKSAKIKKINLTYDTKYYDGLKQLNIGADTTPNETGKIIDGIK